MTAKRKSERGVALLATLMAIALMTIILIDFTSASMLGYRAAANQANALRADYLARSGVEVGLALLAADAQKDAAAGDQAYDGLDEQWAVPYPPIPVDGGFASVSIVDEARKLNINRLIANGQPDPDFSPIFAQLFRVLQVSPDLLPAIVDWLDPDSIPSPGGGAESDYYLRLIPPYEPRNALMPTIGDLRMVKGVDDFVFLRLSQFLTVADEEGDGKININTAPPEVLASLPGLADNLSVVKQIVAARQEKPFRILQEDAPAEVPGLADLLAQPLGPPGDDPSQQKTLEDLLTTRSEYFTITGQGSYAGARKLVSAMVHRTGPGPVQLVSWQED